MRTIRFSDTLLSESLFRKTPIAVAVAASLCLEHAAVVHAADPADALQEIIVTATRRSESIQDTPLNIAAITGGTIEQLRLDKLDDLSHWVPGVAIQNQGPGGASAVVIRGLNTNSLGATGGGPTGGGGAVASYMGEVPLFFDFKLIDIDRVEVLLGPQGTLYGASTLAGAVRYIPNKPDLMNFTGSAHGRVYSLQESGGAGFQGDVAASVSLIEGKLALRGVIGFYDDPGFINYPRLVRYPGISNPEPNFADPNAVAANLYTQNDLNYERTRSARLSLLYQPFDALQMLLTYVNQDTRSGGRQDTSEPLVATGRFENGHRFPEPSKRDLDLVSLEITAQLGFAQLVSASAYGTRDIHSIWDQTDLLLDFQYGYEDFPQFVAFAVEQQKRTQYTQELRLVSNDHSRFKWLIGGFYNHIEDHQPDREYVPGYPQFAGLDRPDALEYYSLIEQKQVEQAAFAEIGYSFTDAWQLTAGGRVFKYNTDQYSATSTPLVDGSGPYGLNLYTLTVSDGHKSSIHKFNTSYKFTPDLMVYATLSEGYRNGGINPVPPCVLPINSINQFACALPHEQGFKPDRTLNHELGIHSEWLEKRLTFNGAVYYDNWNDVRVQGQTQIGQAGITVNGSKAVSKGVELQFHALLPHHFAVTGNYTYNDARLTERAPGLISDAYGRYDGEPGDRLPGSPLQMGSLLLEYSYALSGGYLLDADYGISANSNQFTKIGLRGSGEKVAGFATHAASIGVGKDKWRVTLFAENLTNKYAYTGTDSDISYVRIINGFTVRDYFHSVLRPREIGLEFSTHF